MTKAHRLSRRNFMQASALSMAPWLARLSISAGAIAATACQQHESQSGFVALTASQADDLGAIAARIMPTTETPGATEAGVIHFIDAALAEAMSDRKPPIEAGLIQFNEALKAAHPTASKFSALSETEQDDFLRTQEDTALFNSVRVMTLWGMFALPQYGGNKDYVGWELLGFEGRPNAWQYPFGYYDAQVHNAEVGDE
ncbi:MAG: gluconate 2-dehydrogenase subunit 3 family protein [Pseudomonadota bacterium]